LKNRTNSITGIIIFSGRIDLGPVYLDFVVHTRLIVFHFFVAFFLGMV
jgi:hypothetical protein